MSLFCFRILPTFSQKLMNLWPKHFFLEPEGWYSENESVRRSEGFRKWCFQMKTHVSCNLLPQVFPREMKTHCKMASQIPVHSWGNGKHCPDEHSLADGNSSACFAPRKMLLIFMTEGSYICTFALEEKQPDTKHKTFAVVWEHRMSHNPVMKLIKNSCTSNWLLVILNIHGHLYPKHVWSLWPSCNAEMEGASPCWFFG